MQNVLRYKNVYVNLIIFLIDTVKHRLKWLKYNPALPPSIKTSVDPWM